MGPSMLLETLASQTMVCKPVDKAFVEACQKHREHAGKHCLTIMTPAVASLQMYPSGHTENSTSQPGTQVTERATEVRNSAPEDPKPLLSCTERGQRAESWLSWDVGGSDGDQYALREQRKHRQRQQPPSTDQALYGVLVCTHFLNHLKGHILHLQCKVQKTCPQNHVKLTADSE